MKIWISLLECMLNESMGKLSGVSCKEDTRELLLVNTKLLPAAQI